MREELAGSPAPTQEAAAVKRMRDKDVLFSTVLILGSVATIAYALSLSFKAMAATDLRFHTAPGFFVLLVGVALLLLSISLLATALRQGGDLRWLAPAALRRTLATRSAMETGAVFAYLFLYMCLCWEQVPLLGLHIPFWLGTFVFLCLMVLTFNRQRIMLTILICALAAAAIDVSFRFLIAVPLP